MARASAQPDAGAAIAPADVIDGARALGLGLTARQGDLMVAYARLLMRWSAVHNLTAIRSASDVVSHHLLDSLAIVPAIDAIFGEKPIAMLDVGAGGGLPGIPVAIARPRWDVTLVDKVQKKVAFLTQAKVELGLRDNLHCVHARVEDLQRHVFDLIVSRAFSTLEDFVRVTRHLLAAGGWWAAMKGARPDSELAALAAAFPDVRQVDVVKLDVPRLGAERHLVLLQCR